MSDENKDLLVALDQYLKAGIHIGTKFKTKHMDNFIYKARPDGLFVLNLQKIDERIRVAAKFLSQFKPEDILLVCRRENGFRPSKLFGKVVGCKVFAGRYPPGILTNPELRNFIEAKVLVVTDPWPDRNAIKDAMRMGIPVVALCDTNNQANNIDLIIPCNNKGKKSLGTLFWVMARELLKHYGREGDLTYQIDDFCEE